MRVIDTNLPCDTVGTVEVMALSSSGQLTIIDVADGISDALLVRGMNHTDWVVRNLPIVRRMYAAHVINYSFLPATVPGRLGVLSRLPICGTPDHFCSNPRTEVSRCRSFGWHRSPLRTRRGLNSGKKRAKSDFFVAAFATKRIHRDATC
jgi:hypothetical protein